jgi:hypothetical protein
MKLESTLNIFNECEMIYYDTYNYYQIIYENNKVNLYHFKKKGKTLLIDDDGRIYIDNIEKHLIEKPDEIIKKYNIFKGEILVDRNSFINNNITNLDEIRNIIIKELNISYIDKLILQKTMRYSFLDKFLKNNNLILLDELFFDENYKDSYNFIIEDNNNKIYKVRAYFDERPYDDYEPYYSKFTIIDTLDDY